MKKVMITGATGAIGLALVENLLDNNIKVTVVCHKESKRRSQLAKLPELDIVDCDLNELHTVANERTHDYDVFYHFAWDGTFGNTRNNVEGQIQNIQYTIDAVELAHSLGCRRFIGAGSQAEYGRVDGVLTPSTPAFPENGYGMAKLCAGQMSRLRCEQLGMEHIWTRILSVYGPYDGEKTMVMSLITQMLNHQRPKCTFGEQIWDYTYSKDVAKAFYLLGERGISGKTYCIGSGVGKPLRDYILQMRDLIDSDLEIGFGDIPYQNMQVMHLVADISELNSDTGYYPETSFEKGIQETIEWVKGRGTI